jgi:hypothetical protein
MNVKLSTEPCLLCNSKENTVNAKGKNFQMVVCPKHLLELLKKEEVAVPAQSGGRSDAA